MSNIKKDIAEYLIWVLQDLDGYGIVLSDEALARERLAEYGDFIELKSIVSGK